MAKETEERKSKRSVAHRGIMLLLGTTPLPPTRMLLDLSKDHAVRPPLTTLCVA